MRKEDFIGLYDEDINKKIVECKIRRVYSVKLEDGRILYISKDFNPEVWRNFKYIAKGLRLKDLICNL